MTTYDYPYSGGYADTVATLDDGRVICINTQYETIGTTYGRPQDTTDGIDRAALIADARINGKFGRRPEPPQINTDPVQPPAKGLCPRCQTYCYGDCRA